MTCAKVSMRMMGALPLLALALGGGGLRAAGAVDELVVPPDGIVRGEANARSVAWLVQADGSDTPVLNPASVARLGISTGMIGIGVKVLVGPVPVRGKTGVFRYRVGGEEQKRRGAWFERPITDSADGMLGPGAVPQRIVTFQLRPARADEQLQRFPLVDHGYAGMGLMAGAIFVQFDPQSEDSVATASAAATLALSHGGAFTGAPSSRPLRFGIVRPVRALRLATPLSVAGLSLRSLVVRTQDFGDASAIRDSVNDPEEIVVSASKGGRGAQYQTLHLGADALRACSRITFDRLAGEVILSCRNAS